MTTIDMTIRDLARAIPGGRFRLHPNPQMYGRGSRGPSDESLHVITEGREGRIGYMPPSRWAEPFSGLQLLILEQAAREECEARGWRYGIAYDTEATERPYTGFVRRIEVGSPVHNGLHERTAESATHAQLLALLEAATYAYRPARVLHEPWTEERLPRLPRSGKP